MIKRQIKFLCPEGGVQVAGGVRPVHYLEQRCNTPLDDNHILAEAGAARAWRATFQSMNAAAASCQKTQENCSDIASVLCHGCFLRLMLESHTDTARYLRDKTQDA